jgi:UDP-N-acetylmuramate dehydrogenase
MKLGREDSTHKRLRIGVTLLTLQIRMQAFKEIQKELPGVKENISLKEHSTFRIGGRAKYYYKPERAEDVIKAILVAKKLNLPLFVLGKGSKLLISDNGYDGMVIHFLFPFLNFQNSKVSVLAGTPLPLLVSEAAKKSLSGLEWAVGIPGTVGGAIRGNAGAFGGSMAEVVKTVEAFNVQKEKTERFSSQGCEFNYRESVFKKKPNLIIVSASLEFKTGNKDKIQKRMKEYLMSRKEKQPLGFFSAGSIFKNPPDVSAGELIDRCGLKGKRIGDVQVSKKHANFIVNLGKGKAEDVMTLIKLIKKEVKGKFGVTLEEEIQYLGF